MTTSTSNAPSSSPPPPPPTTTTTPSIEAKVFYQKRSFTDLWFGIVYLLNWIGFLTCGFILVGKAHPRYNLNAETGERTIHEYYYDDVVQCCASANNNNNKNNNNDNQIGGLCDYLNDDVGRGRQLQAGRSTFDRDDGIFDAFLGAPEIICGLLALTITIALLWAILLRFFAKPVVFLTEVVKIAALIALAVYQKDTTSRALLIVISIGVAIYAWVFRAKIALAAKMIEESVVALKANPSVFLGGILTKAVFAGNAALFVLFFSKSYNVVHVEEKSTLFSSSFNDFWEDDIYNQNREDDVWSYCEWSYPRYVSRINIFLGLSYLWTIMLIEQVRLSIISTIIGSWHFHPSDIPSVFRAILNSIYSFGTLAISSLISTIAEKLNRMINQPSCIYFCSPTIVVSAPLSILLCFFGTCIKATIQMLTKYAVILHTFTGKSFVQAGKAAFGILSRHFIGGFVTEVTSQSVLTLASYAFSYGITMLTWIWIDDKFNCNSFPSTSDQGMATFLFFLYTVLILFNLYFPVVGLYIMIFLNRILQNGDTGLQHYWIPPLASIFVGCIAMMFFMFLSRLFLDTINVKFLCYAIDKENSIQNENNANFEKLLKEVPGYIESSSTTSTDVESHGGDEMESEIIVEAIPVPDPIPHPVPSAPPKSYDF